MNPRHLVSLPAVVLASMLAATPPADAGLVVTIQAIKVCDDDGTNCASANTYESFADKIWAQAGIDFMFLPTLQWNSTAYNAYDADADDGSLLAAGTAAFAPGPNVLNMYFVEDLLTAFGTLFGYGCGAPVYETFCFNQTGVVINSTAVDSYGTIGRIDTVAHEVGHVLGLTHEDAMPDATYLMRKGSARTVPQSLDDINPDGDLLSKLSAAQITTALDSSFVTAVPEPGSLALVALALAGIGVVRRRSISG